MQIQIDTREHKKELARIEGQLEALGVTFSNQSYMWAIT